MTIAVKTHSYYGEPGGEKLDSEVLRAAGIRADLTKLVSNFDLGHAAKITDAILAHYDLKEKK